MLLDDVQDGTRHFDEPALYYLLKRVHGASEQEMAAGSERVSPKKLLRQSAARRGTWVEIIGHYVESTSFRLSNRLEYKAPVHVTLLVTPDGADAFQVVTFDRPPGGKPGRLLRARGLYFKYRRDASRSGSAHDGQVLVPILVASGLEHVARFTAAPGSRRQLEVAFGLVAALAFVYFLVRRAARRATRPARTPAARAPRRKRLAESDRTPIDLDAWRPSRDASPGDADAE